MVKMKLLKIAITLVCIAWFISVVLRFYTAHPEASYGWVAIFLGTIGIIWYTWMMMATGSTNPFKKPKIK